MISNNAIECIREKFGKYGVTFRTVQIGEALPIQTAVVIGHPDADHTMLCQTIDEIGKAAVEFAAYGQCSFGLCRRKAEYGMARLDASNNATTMRRVCTQHRDLMVERFGRYVGGWGDVVTVVFRHQADIGSQPPGDVVGHRLADALMRGRSANSIVRALLWTVDSAYRALPNDARELREALRELADGLRDATSEVTP